jgi:serine phosphatase RsbU (regulator of sigma subunit)
VGTFGGGLNKFDPQKGIVVAHYREKDGLPNDVVYGILPDEQGCLWLSTNKGLSKFNPRAETFKNYTSRDGLQSNEFNGGAYYKSNSGEMFFGGLNGFNAFYPREFKDNKNKPPIVITDFQIFNKSIGIGSESPLKKHISETKEIILPYEKNVFSFKFVALDYTLPGNNQYQYMMEGFDKEWIFTDASKRFATYTNLDAGEYVFRVKGSNNDGVWNEEGTSIKIIITPPFWQTWWFRVISVLVVVVLALLYYRIRMRIIYQKTRLEAELQAAHAAQMSIMPQSDPQLEGFFISGICVPAYEVGGDFFDYLWLSPGKTKFGIAIGDVSGKAMKAAMTAVMSSGMLYSKADCADSIKDIMTEVNRPLFSKTDKKMFTALCLAALDLRTKEFIFTNAGLSEPLLKSQNKAAYIESVGPRLPLGSFEDNTYQETKFQLKPFDVVVLFTDGVPDAQNHRGEFYGYDTLRQLVEQMDTTALSAVEIKEAIITDVNKFSGGVPQQDDMTVVVIKYQSPA